MSAAGAPKAESEDLEGGESIVRAPEEGGEILRDRMERPARVGRFALALLGVVTASVGVAEWVTSRTVVGLSIGLFGVILLALAVVQQHLYSRDLAHWPDQAILWKEGLELVLHNGEVRGVTWAESDFALHLVERRAPIPANREYLLIWLPDPKIPPVELSADGFERLNRVASDRNLSVVESRRGSRPDATRLIEIRRGTYQPLDEVS